MGYIKKTVVFAFCFTSFIGFSQTEQVKWTTDINFAIEKSLTTKKPLMLFFTGSDWCGWCKRLKRDVLDTPVFAVWANKNVISVELDFPRKKQLPPELINQNNQLKNIFNIRGYPTVFFSTIEVESDNGNVNFNVLGSCGYNPAGSGTEAWIKHVEDILNKN